MEKSTQQPVAYMTYKGYLLHAADPKVKEHSNPVPLFDFPPTPRDVLIAALYELSNACLELNGNGIGCDVISAIADRYSDKSQLVELEKDAARLNFIEKRHDMRLSTRSGKWWAFDKFSNYEQATYATLREAIDAAIESEALGQENI